MRQTTHSYFTERPYGLLLFTGIVLSLLIALLPIVNTDLQDKTMFSVPLPVFVWIVPLFLLSFWLLYLGTKKFLYSKTFTWTHILLTVVTTILIVLLLYVVFNLSPSGFSETSSEDRQKLIGNVIRVVFILFVGGQCTYFLNVLLGLFSKHK